MWVSFNKRTLLTVSYSALVKLFCREDADYYQLFSFCGLSKYSCRYVSIISYICKLIVDLALQSKKNRQNFLKFVLSLMDHHFRFGTHQRNLNKFESNLLAPEKGSLNLKGFYMQVLKIIFALSLAGGAIHYSQLDRALYFHVSPSKSPVTVEEIVVYYNVILAVGITSKFRGSGKLKSQVKRHAGVLFASPISYFETISEFTDFFS